MGKRHKADNVYAFQRCISKLLLAFVILYFIQNDGFLRINVPDSENINIVALVSPCPRGKWMHRLSMFMDQERGQAAQPGTYFIATG